MKRGFSTEFSQRKIKIFGSVLIYILLLAILLFFVWKDANPENKTAFGSLEGRFLSDVVMMHDGETYYYRENEITNYLVIGSDRERADKDAGYQNGAQADFLVLLSVDRISRTITPVMLDRDTMTPVQTIDMYGHPSDKRMMQLHLAQTYSGEDTSGSVNTAKAVEELFYGVKIDRCITVDLTAVSLLNDAIGGVEVTLEDDFTAYDPSFVKGATVRLNGEQAMCFMRGERTAADGTSASGMMCQQQYMRSFLTQLRQKSKKDTELLTGLMNAVSEYMQSDTSPLMLLRDVRRYKEYLWQPILTPEGSYTNDEFGFAEFWVNDIALQEFVLERWFVKAEQS